MDDKVYAFNGRHYTKDDIFTKHRMLKHANEEDPITSEVEEQFREYFDTFLYFLVKLDYLKKNSVDLMPHPLPLG